MNQTRDAVRLEHVSFEYSRDRVLIDIDLRFPTGEVTVILGPSGSGKSTLLRLIAGLLEPTAGSITVDTGNQSRSERLPTFSMVFQDHVLYPHLSIEENIVLAFQADPATARERRLAIAELAPPMGLQDVLGRRPKDVSGGQRQRAALLKTLASGAPIWLMDEPLTNVDSQVRLKLRSLISRLQRQASATLIYVTHDLADALTLADYVTVIRDGRILQTGSAYELLTNPSDVHVAKFLSNPPMNEFEVLGDSITANELRLTFRDGSIVRYPSSSQVPPTVSTPMIALLSSEDITPGEMRKGPQYLAVTGRVDLIEIGPKRSRVECTTPLGTLNFFCEEPARPRRGESLNLNIELCALRLFDSVTGRSLP